MHTPNLSFAKIVATPTDVSWSQAYNAGSLFVVLSLTTPSENDENELINLGKNVINNLEAEFFALETKNLKSIKEALQISIRDIPESVITSLAIAFIKEEILYVLLYGAGCIAMKRTDSFAPILVRKEHINDIKSASGYIKQNDLIILQTDQFTDLVSLEELKESLDLTLPSDIAEALSPRIHNTDKGGAAAVILMITGVPFFTTTETTMNTSKENEESVSESNDIDESEAEQPHKSIFTALKNLSFFQLSMHLKKMHATRIVFHKKKNIKTLILTAVALAIIVFLTVYVYNTIQSKNEQQLEKKFSVIFNDAKSKYATALSIKSVTPDKADELLQKVESDLKTVIPQFNQSPNLNRQLTDLLKQIKEQILPTVQISRLKEESVDIKESPILKAIIDHKSTLSAVEDASNIYLLSPESIITLDKVNGKEKTVIKNENDWKEGIALGTYNGNLYVLDKKDGIVKFVVAENGYGKASYFQDSKPDLSNAVSMSVDGSIWILSANGQIAKYTKGKQEQFLAKLPETLNKPVLIYTTTDVNNLYIIDSGKSTLFQLQKDGTLKSTYTASVLSSTTAFTVSTDEKTVYVLSKDKVYKLNLQ
jgi:hypothetical protein